MMLHEEIYQVLTQIAAYNGIVDKNQLASKIQETFQLNKDGKLFYNDVFAIRFSQAKQKKMGNTVLALSKLKKYDDRPVIVCIVTPTVNYCCLVNTTFLKKISHSSQALTLTNIKGSFNGSDIMMEFAGLANEPQNFEQLWSYHQERTFTENLERLVENTNGIIGRNHRLIIDESVKQQILQSVERTQQFFNSKDVQQLMAEFEQRIISMQQEIRIATQTIDNVNVRGRVIEFLITEENSQLKKQIIQALHQKQALPEFKTENQLADFACHYDNFEIAVDIKSKVLTYESNPKAYNVDKLLHFLSQENSVYLILLVGIAESGDIILRLCSIFDQRLLPPQTRIIAHWAGRSSRGVAQFLGSGLSKIIQDEPKVKINRQMAQQYLENLIAL